MTRSKPISLAWKTWVYVITLILAAVRVILIGEQEICAVDLPVL